MSTTKTLRVGLAIGRGTGPELADVFERVMLRLSNHFSVRLDLTRSPRLYHSYYSLLAEYHDQNARSEKTQQDTAHYESFCKAEAAKDTHAIFRTAINAQSLYLVRQHLEAVKIEYFNKESDSLLLIRDQAQGFYTGSNQHDPEGGVISRTCQFSKELTSRILLYSISRAQQLWGHIDSVAMVYKFHLFDGVFSDWAAEWSKEHGIMINFVQPDTANRNLLAHGLQGCQLIIAGNEWADIMHVILLDMFGKGTQEARSTENVYLHTSLHHHLSEYQTVHGSADDLTGKGSINPSATLQAAAAILERHGGCKGVEGAMDRTLQDLRHKNLVTPDQGGEMSTIAVVDSVLEILTATESSNGSR
ncbi:hypothetical protein MMC14_005634 [Varicellaria rhodocarpa]|nr:hypothetical protein [Varicellaria rhodocarpa]